MYTKSHISANIKRHPTSKQQRHRLRMGNPSKLTAHQLSNSNHHPLLLLLPRSHKKGITLSP